MSARIHVSRLAALGAGLILTLACSGAAAAAGVQDPIPVTPGTFFTGVVNGQSNTAWIRTDCVGPVASGFTGHPLPGQYVEADSAEASSLLVGYTGSEGRALVVSLGVPDVTGGGSSWLLGMTGNFYAPMPIPTSINVPCSGSGVVAFNAAPGSDTARPATVMVRFVSQP